MHLDPDNYPNNEHAPWYANMYSYNNPARACIKMPKRLAENGRKWTASPDGGNSGIKRKRGRKSKIQRIIQGQCIYRQEQKSK